ncbi:YicC/YloC family endoribonuclease [Planctomicrobium piriforme]|uniref:TIGR00255 family protein n=1 Tax=Planctomicrobium piriforme TaxID=1576369 RepID=A0A1I3CE20_9PLAN|nr:YicC/YloC family endoribonuclease [Planctomicrobium piriforme]SFH72784.1 TIGR00255 family protein [Planctomicrobium piriforme]
MTGHGDANGQNERLSVTIEVRSVNNRHLKVTVRCPDAFIALEANIDRVVREVISRGTLTIHLHIRHVNALSSYHVNSTVARQYFEQLRELSRELGLAEPAELTPLLALPGVIDDGESRSVEESDWPLLETALITALENLQNFRRQEGAAMAAELRAMCLVIEENAEQIALRAPKVVAEYRERIKNRINDFLSTQSVKVDDNDLIREVSMFADRCDISEELTRLRSHLQQYRTLLDSDGSNGRKLEFLGQELFREINTTGSKANDVEIAHRVVEMKAAIEKMREIILNVE